MLADWRTAWEMRGLLVVLVTRELASRHAGTVGGLIWLYIPPLVSIAVYYLVFDIVFGLRMGEGTKTTAVGSYLVIGMIPWMAFCEGLSRTSSSLVEAAVLLQKNAMKPLLLVLRNTLAAAVVYIPLLILLVLLYSRQHNWTLAIMAFPLLVAMQFALIYLLGHALAILTAAVRDIAQVVGFLLSVGVFLSPILFPLNMFPEGWRWALYLNPMTAWVLGYQAVLLQGQWPPVSVWAGVIGWLTASFLVLRPVVNRSRDELVDWL